MIKKSQELIEFEKELVRREKVNIMHNFKIFEYMYREARELGILPLKDHLEGLDIDIKIAKVINSVPITT